MAISDDIKANILRYHHVEKWRVGTIARQLNIHHTTVKRVLSETGVSKHNILVQESMIDPYLPFIRGLKSNGTKTYARAAINQKLSSKIHGYM